MDVTADEPTLQDQRERNEQPYLRGRRAWQVTFLMLALVPTSMAIVTLAAGTARFIDSADVVVGLDSNFRFLGGVYLALALLALWSVLKIEERSQALVFATGAIFLGGIGRLISIADVGAPATYTWFILIVELGALFLALTLRRSIKASSEQA